ncbi:MAG: SDR family oxidoreductase [Hyphomicrobiaceae bacterium]|nr:SDR family oxidoreductase [Hyphomicrobiaceae bacterium]
MFMSVVTHSPGVPVYAELAGSRVLVTGLSEDVGVDLARAFADHKCRLVLQSAHDTPGMAAVTALVAETASETRAYTQPLADGNEAVRFAQGPAQSFGGLDTAVNLITITPEEMRGRATLEEIEDFVSEKLLAATLMTRVIANRMQLTLTEGLIFNVVVMAPPANDAETALAGILRSTLATITRREAESWAGKAIRVNAVGPRGLLEPEGACLSSGPDIAALALYLASRKGRQLTGHVFDAHGVATRGC